MATRQIPLTFDYGTERIGTCEYDDETGIVTMQVRDPQVIKMLDGTGDKGITMGMSILMPPEGWTAEPEPVRVPSRPVTVLTTLQFSPSMGEKEIHLEADLRLGQTLCGLSLFPTDTEGRAIKVGFSRRGGVTGPDYRRVPCPRCRDVAHDKYGFVRIEDNTFKLDWSKP